MALTDDQKPADVLLPLVYNELRKLAANLLAREQPFQTLEATALVHEAYLRLTNVPAPQKWDNKGHFFAAAAKAMRRILVDNARRKGAAKNGGGALRLGLADAEPLADDQLIDILVLSDALDLLAEEDPVSAALAELRVFAGLSVDEAAVAIDMPHTTAYRKWTYANAWLIRRLRDTE